MISSEQIPTNTVTGLTGPSLTPDNLLTVVSKKIIYREGGIRLEHEEVNGKHLFHNYGHGSSGIALAYGSAFLSTKTMDSKIDPTQHSTCAVVGSGLIALLTAVELTKRGHPVTVYADRFPKYGENDNTKKIASQVDEGLYLPFGYDTSDRLKYELISKISHDYYKQCLKANRYQSFKTTYVYERDATIEQLKQKIPGFLNNTYKKESLSFDHGVPENYIRMKTFKIDVELFLEELKVEATLRGAKFVERKFSTREEILALKENAIFNCTGQFSRVLFDDKKIGTRQDNLVVFKNPSQLEYSMSAQLSDNLIMRIHCFGDKVILRNESVNQGESPSVEQMIQEAQLFFSNKALHPKL